MRKLPGHGARKNKHVDKVTAEIHPEIANQLNEISEL